MVKPGHSSGYLISIVALLGLAACAHPGTPAHGPAAPAPVAVSGTAPSVPGASVVPAGFSVPPTRPALSLAQIAQLKNLTSADLTARLGQPDFQRQDETAQIWQYRGPTCVLDVFLYPEDGTLKVVHAVTRSRTGSDGSEGHCLPYAMASAG